MKLFDGNILGNVRNTSVACMKFSIESKRLSEKIFWISMGAFGTILVFGLVNNLISSWSDNPIVISEIQSPLKNVDFPAITFCHKGNARFSIAERIMNSVIDEGIKVRKIRNLVLRTTVEFIIAKFDGYFTFPRLIYNDYHKYCIDSMKKYDYCRDYNILFSFSKATN